MQCPECLAIDVAMDELCPTCGRCPECCECAWEPATEEELGGDDAA